MPSAATRNIIIRQFFKLPHPQHEVGLFRIYNTNDYMGFLDDQQKKAEAKANAEVSGFLIDGEDVDQIFMNVEDYIAFTNKRLIFVDKSLTSSKKAVHSIPYQKLITVSFLKGGTFSIAKEIEVAISGHTYEIKAYDNDKAMLIYKKLMGKLFEYS